MTMPVDVYGVRASDDTPLRVINSNTGITNHINKKKVFEYANSVFSQIAEKLSAHCGPLSRYALVITPSGGKYETNTFTKDGRNIINCISFTSPIEEIFKEMMLYIASRVDNIASDGTTTSMIFASLFFKNMTKDMSTFDSMSSSSFINGYNRFQKEILNRLDGQRVTLDDLIAEIYNGATRDEISNAQFQDIVSKVAYYQAMSSSGGNTEISEVMRQIYLHSPESTWNLLNIYHNKRENLPTYSHSTDHHEFTLDIHLVHKEMLNYQIGTEYYSDKCDLLVIPDSVNEGSLSEDAIIEYLLEIQKDEDRTKDLLVFYPRMSRSVLAVIINHNTATNSKFKIIACEYLNNILATSYSQELFGLAVSCGTFPYMIRKNSGHITDDNIIKDVSAHYQMKNMHLNGIFDHVVRRFPHLKGNNKLNDVENPLYTCPGTFDEYDFFLAHVHGLSTSYKTNVNQNQLQTTIDALDSLIALMTTPKRGYLVVSGKSHDHAEAVDVLRDVCGAIIASLKHGFVVGSAAALGRILNGSEEETEIDSESTSDNSDIAADRMFTYLSNSVTDLITSICIGKPVTEEKPSYEDTCKIDNYYDNAINHKNKYDYANITDNGTIGGSIIKDIVYGAATYPIIQPCQVFEQVFSRIGDLMTKLITTDCIIVPGGVYIENKSEE